MLIQGHIQNGVVVVDTPISLPNGTPVTIEAHPSSATPEPPKTKFLEHFREVIGTVELPEDAALNHDKYLYGESTE